LSTLPEPKHRSVLRVQSPHLLFDLPGVSQGSHLGDRIREWYPSGDWHHSLINQHSEKQFFFFGGGRVALGFELRASHLQTSCSTSWATAPARFALVILEIGLTNYLPGLASKRSPPDLSLPRTQNSGC
jgi:hypothetical protein